MQLLYHVNFGLPLLDAGSQFCAPATAVVPRDARAAEGIATWDRYAAEEAGYAEQVYFLRLRSDDAAPSGPSAGSERIYFSRGSSWRLLGGQGIEADGARSARLTRFLGDVALIPDTEPPSVSMLQIRNPRQPRITFRYGDDRSGVDSHALKTYIDGEFVIPEIDGEHRRVVIHSTGPLSRGSHRLTIHLTDQLGNARVTERSFSVR